MSDRVVKCNCIPCQVAVYRISRTPKNPDRPFYTCPNKKTCGFFTWADELPTSTTDPDPTSNIVHLGRVFQFTAPPTPAVPTTVTTAQKRKIEASEIDFDQTSKKQTTDPVAMDTTSTTPPAPVQAVITPPVNLDNSLFTEFTSLKGALAKKEKELDDVSQKLAELLEKYNKEERSIKKYKKDLQTAKQDGERARTTVTQLTKQLEQARTETTTARKDAEAARKVTNDLEKAIEALSNDVESLKRFNIEGQPPNPKRDVDLISCKICYDHPLQTIFYPCRHAILCQGCTEKTMQEKKPCPLCRGKIHMTGRVYLAE